MAHESFVVHGDDIVTVLVSTVLLAELGEWSDPVHVMIRETPGVGTGWELIFRDPNAAFE